MSSITVTVSGVEPNALMCEFFPPLELTGSDWYVGLLDFTTYNSIPNIIKGVNNVFPVQIDDKWTPIELPTGAYEIEDIESYMKKSLPNTTLFSLRPNNNTLKCELFCSLNIYFKQSENNNNIGSVLGFTEKKLLEAYKTHTSNDSVNIIKVNTIRITCNIVQGSYKDGKDEHTLHSFYPTVEPGFKIVETPRNVIYLPVNVQRLYNITLSIVDQDGDPINFQGEVITARIHLKRLL